MPYKLPLPPVLQNAGWQVKIYDAERLEPPHITIIQKGETWRLSLRDRSFLDKDQKWSQIHRDVRAAIEENWDKLIEGWNELHPGNPVKK